MTLEEATQQLWQAAEKKRSCRISLEGEPLPRIVEPYGIARTSRNRVVLVCWQSGGLTKAGGTAGYRNLQLDRIIAIEMIDLHYARRNDFNSDDTQYKEWVFHI